MKKALLLFLFSMPAILTRAQNQSALVPEPPFGTVNMEYLSMKKCDFEPDANAMVLFDYEKCHFLGIRGKDVITERHTCIKIFNDHAADQGNISIRFLAVNFESVSRIEAETINLDNGKVEISKLDKKLIYVRKINRAVSEMVFSMPNVKSGSVIEYKYIHESMTEPRFPRWYSQITVPMLYSELRSSLPYNAPVGGRVKGDPSVKVNIGITKVFSPKNDPDNFVYAVSKSLSLPNEPYMRSFVDVLADATYKPAFSNSYDNPVLFSNIDRILLNADDFGLQLDKTLKGEDSITNKAFLLNAEEERLAYIFNEVKNLMKWNGFDDLYTDEGVIKAWKNRTGNSTEINLILYHLLTVNGIKASPVLVSTRENGKITPYTSKLSDFNRTVVLATLRADSTKHYLLDATDKYGTFNQVSYNLLNSFGLCLDVENKSHSTVFIKDDKPEKKVILINAEIMPDGKMNGNAQIVDYGYNKAESYERYNTEGEKKYIAKLQNNDNNVRVSSLKLENARVDTLPLTQTFNFNINLSASDQNYIYFNPNLFSPLTINPFLAETRVTDIDFGYCNNFQIRGSYKVPDKYTIDAIPKTITLATPDKSILFKRLAGEQEGAVVIQYSIAFNKSVFSKNEYPAIHDFYKKMFELLNEQIVLKKI